MNRYSPAPRVAVRVTAETWESLLLGHINHTADVLEAPIRFLDPEKIPNFARISMKLHSQGTEP